MLVKILLAIAAGAVIGAGVGATRSCETGGCPLTANPKRGAMYGGLLGLAVGAMLVTSPAGQAAKHPESIPQTASVAAFDEDVLGKDKAAAYFTAEWCGNCTAFAPTLDEVAREHGDDVAFRRVDIDALPTLASRYDVQAVPTVLFFKDGDVVGRLLGRSDKARVEEYLRILSEES